MANCFGQDVIVTIEQPDGQVFRGKAQAVRIDMRHPLTGIDRVGDSFSAINRIGSWEIELSGYGDLFWDIRENFAQRTRASRSAVEWRCDFCGSVHPRAATKCVQCGAARSFLYD